MAGTGKTTILHTIALEIDRMGSLGASFFFCRRGDADLKRADAVISTLAYQLAEFNRDFARLLAEALGGRTDVCDQTHQRQAERLLVQPLRGLSRDIPPILLVLDALDECEEEGLKAVLPLILAAIQSSPVSIKLLVASRPEPHIEAIFKTARRHHPVVLHEIEECIVQDDIAKYLNGGLAAIPKEVGREQDLETPWFTTQELEYLVAAAASLFIYASTALLFIADKKERDPRGQLDILLLSDASASVTDTPYALLDQLYTEVLDRELAGCSERALNRFQDVMGTIVLLQDSLTLRETEVLAGRKLGDMRAALIGLHSVILMPDSDDGFAHVYHKSFEDYITSPDRSGRYCVNTEEYDAFLGARCLEIILDDLNSHTSGEGWSSADAWATRGNNISAWLKYACVYWATHVKRASLGHQRLRQLLCQLLERGILWWLEILCVLRRVDTAVVSARDAEDWAVSQAA